MGSRSESGTPDTAGKRLLHPRDPGASVGRGADVIGVLRGGDSPVGRRLEFDHPTRFAEAGSQDASPTAATKPPGAGLAGSHQKAFFSSSAAFRSSCSGGRSSADG